MGRKGRMIQVLQEKLLAELPISSTKVNVDHNIAVTIWKLDGTFYVQLDFYHLIDSTGSSFKEDKREFGSFEVAMEYIKEHTGLDLLDFE